MKKLGLLFLMVFTNLLVYAQFKVVGYLPTWNGYPSSINNVDLTKLTHLNIAFANPDVSGNIILSGGTLADLATVVTAAHAENVKVLLSIGGAGAPGATYATLITSNQATFVSNLLQFCIDNNLDGIDVDIEGDVLNGTTLTASQYENFIVNLEVALHGNSKLMTAALATWFASRVTNLAASKFDFINVMSYDDYGTWTGPGQHAPYDLAVDDFTYWNTTKAMPASKLTVGLPFYGYYWFVNGSNSQSYKNIYNNNVNAAYKDKVVRPNGGGLIYYNGIPTIKQKTAYAMAQAGGVMIWELTGDVAGSFSLLNAINEVVNNYSTNVAPTCSISNPSASATFTEGDIIPIQVNANDVDGTILIVEYFAGAQKIGESYAGSTTIDWEGACPGTYTLTAKVTDNTGSYVISSGVSVTVNASGLGTSFGGVPHQIPGKIEAENFNYGGTGNAFYDVDLQNKGFQYRTGPVDIEDCIDFGGGYNVGWIDPNEWLEFDVNVATDNYYTFKVRYATQSTNRSAFISIDGLNVTGNLTITNSSGWQKWAEVTSSPIYLTAGLKKMRIQTATGGFNLNYILADVSTSTILFNDFYSNKNHPVLFPNPVVKDATLSLQLKAPSFTKIKIISATGQELKTIFEGNLEGGEYSFLLANLNLANGLYRCCILQGEVPYFVNFMVTDNAE